MKDREKKLQLTSFHHNIEKFFKEKGLRKGWMAEQLNMSRGLFTNITQGRSRLPPKYWKKLLELSEGYISIKDILENCMAQRESEILDIKEIGDKKTCIISLK